MARSEKDKYIIDYLRQCTDEEYENIMNPLGLASQQRKICDMVIRDWRPSQYICNKLNLSKTPVNNRKRKAFDKIYEKVPEVKSFIDSKLGNN